MRALTRLHRHLEWPDAALRRFVAHQGEYCEEEQCAMTAYFEMLLLFAGEEHLRVDAMAKENFAAILYQYRDTLDSISCISDNLRIYLVGNFGLRNILLEIQRNAYIIIALMNCRGLYRNLLLISRDTVIRSLALLIEDLFDGPFAALESIRKNLAALTLVLKNWDKISSSDNFRGQQRSMNLAIHNLFELQSTNEELIDVINEVQTGLEDYLRKYNYLNAIQHLIQTICLIAVTVALACLLWILFWIGHNFDTNLPSMKKAPSFQIYVKETLVLYAWLGPLVYLFYIGLMKKLTQPRVFAMREIEHYLHTNELLKAAYLRIKRFTETLI